MVEATPSYRERMKAQRAELRAKREAQQAELHRPMALRVEVQRRGEIAVKQAIRNEGRRRSRRGRRQIRGALPGLLRRQRRALGAGNGSPHQSHEHGRQFSKRSLHLQRRNQTSFL